MKVLVCPLPVVGFKMDSKTGSRSSNLICRDPVQSVPVRLRKRQGFKMDRFNEVSEAKINIFFIPGNLKHFVIFSRGGAYA